MWSIVNLFPNATLQSDIFVVRMIRKPQRLANKTQSSPLDSKIIPTKLWKNQKTQVFNGKIVNIGYFFPQWTLIFDPFKLKKHELRKQSIHFSSTHCLPEDHEFQSIFAENIAFPCFTRLSTVAIIANICNNKFFASNWNLVALHTFHLKPSASSEHRKYHNFYFLSQVCSDDIQTVENISR